MKRLLCLAALLAVNASLFGATPLHHYTFDGAVTDLVGTADGTLNGGAVASGGVLTLDGSTGYVQFDEFLVPTTGAFSMAMFAQETTPINDYIELISQGSSGAPGFYMGHNPGQVIRVGDPWINTGTPFPTDGLMHHYALTVDAVQSVLYIDGSQVNSTGPIGFGSGGTHTRLGRQFSSFSEYFPGKLDEVWVFSGALTTGEVAALAAVPEPATFLLPLLTGLVLWGFKTRRNQG